MSIFLETVEDVEIFSTFLSNTKHTLSNRRHDRLVGAVKKYKEALDSCVGENNKEEEE